MAGSAGDVALISPVSISDLAPAQSPAEPWRFLAPLWWMAWMLAFVFA